MTKIENDFIIGVEDDLDSIQQLSLIFYRLFDSNLPNTTLNPVLIDYKFNKENANGLIEYKRTLLSYSNKNDKLLRQIYWRIYEGLVTENTKMCYYIIGLDDSGISANISEKELAESLDILNLTIQNTELKSTYLYVKNIFDNSLILIIRLWLDNTDNRIEYF